mmetsp:Transcript_28290/g.52599  ORF Transcript_28290/g.52599 Transcript_28290/m.52599 type:complete len:205 (-) Transcript_28290:349-963(-)
MCRCVCADRGQWLRGVSRLSQAGQQDFGAVGHHTDGYCYQDHAHQAGHNCAGSVAEVAADIAGEVKHYRDHQQNQHNATRVDAPLRGLLHLLSIEDQSGDGPRANQHREGHGVKRNIVCIRLVHDLAFPFGAVVRGATSTVEHHKTNLYQHHATRDAEGVYGDTKELKDRGARDRDDHAGNSSVGEDLDGSAALFGLMQVFRQA